MEKLGLLAGIGHLPAACARAARAQGYEVHAVALLPDCDPELKEAASTYRAISIGAIAEILAYLQQEGITKVTMIGKVTKELLFTGAIQPDEMLRGMLMQLPNQNDDTIMMMFVGALMKIGITPLDQTALIRPLMPPAGVLTSRAPSDAERADMAYGLQMAREIGRLDVGQTAVVKNRAVMALEAIEGTDACIRRGGQLAGGGAVVAKAAKPQQDSRFDVPAVGLDTIESLVAAKASALVIEADDVPILLLPGSRREEIERLLPPMLGAVEILAGEDAARRFFLPVADGVDEERIRAHLAAASVPVTLTHDARYALMGAARAAMAASGTVVMEAAIMGLPAVVLYRLSALSYLVGRLLVDVPRFSLPNILVGETFETELLQDAVQPARIAAALAPLLTDGAARSHVTERLARAVALLGAPHAARRVAERILALGRGT